MRIRRLATVAALCGGLLLTSPEFASAQEATGIPLTVRTVPGLAGIRFVLGDSEFTSDENGIARTAVPVAGIYDLRVDSPTIIGDERRAGLIRWSDGVEGRRREISISGATELSAGFEVAYIVREQWRDANGEDVRAGLLDSFTITDDSGSTYTQTVQTHGRRGPTALVWQRHPAGTRWLVGTRIESLPEGMTSREVAYGIEQVSVDGVRVDATAAPFYPARTDEWSIDLSAFEVTLAARGLLFEAPSDSRLSIADSHGRARSLGGPGERTILLPPGRYAAHADATGVAFDSNFELPGPARVDVTVVGAADLGVLALVFGLVVGAVALWRVRSRGERVSAGVATVPDGAGAERAVASRTKDLVRVHLDTGRTIEGWTDVESDFGGVMILDVIRVLDRAGTEVAPSPFDSFVLTARVEKIEHLQAPGNGNRGGNSGATGSLSDGPVPGSVRAHGAPGPSP
jgi:hypothetical protein